jgi:H+/gluconate symporter-like permease
MIEAVRDVLAGCWVRVAAWAVVLVAALLVVGVFGPVAAIPLLPVFDVAARRFHEAQQCQ